MSLNTQDNLTFRYSGFLQNVDIQLTSATTPDGYRVSCAAKLKLPIMKKDFMTWTVFSDPQLQWLLHSPVTEVGNAGKTVERAQYSPQAIDPIGFFLKINRGEWELDRVHLVLGGKEVSLAVEKKAGSIIVSRPEKNQKLIIKMGSNGIEALEIPVPIIGNLQIKRVGTQ